MKPRRREIRRHFTPVKTEVDGYTFDSKAEARRYGLLKLLCMEHGPRYRHLRVHPRLPMHINGKALGRGYMVLDFAYEKYEDGAWREIIEDVKGAEGADTRYQKLRRQVCELVNDITIRVTNME